jgi:hypothetical protein
MIIETIVLVGFVFAATALAAVVFERRMDVLHGPYIEGRNVSHPTIALKRFWTPVREAADGFSWKARNVAYFASVIA